ncbi:transcriptional regulator [Sinorhizobium meliloti]|uniref:transcriptional regulator n=1 Tax=Rhizobium meliloti TaxID=382 RepID=UPI000FDB694A|nr:Cro/CI family transcriptional regulator [Sinorhizobium meliloti]RVM04554.1 CI repressor [Sinorhizobium meliloti]RVO22175.1 CI repressor [Sinorhizobium meliloti]
MTTIDPSLALVIDRVGSASELARKLGITPAAVLQWQRVPVSRVLSVERISGVSRHVLRPDFYPPSEAAE